MSSNPHAIGNLHDGGLVREQTAIVAVNVSCGAGHIGLLVQDAKGYAAIQLSAEEAAHIAGLLGDSVAKLKMADSRPE